MSEYFYVRSKLDIRIVKADVASCNIVVTRIAFAFGNIALVLGNTNKNI